MTSDQRVVVVGASMAGLRAAEQLRSAGHAGPITVIGAEDHLPYNRPPLSKDVLAGADPATAIELAEKLAFRRRASTADVEFVLGDAVVSADLAGRTVTTESGSTFAWDGLVVATGLRPRRLSLPGPAAGRHVLRTVDDCFGLRSELATPRRVVVVGAGFIGCEAAATLTKLGHRVTVVEPAGRPMERVLGADLAGAIQRHHEARGIEFRLGTWIIGCTGEDRVDGVLLGTGEELPADVVIEAAGSVANTEWLDGNGLDLTDGVLTDNHLAVVGAERVVAVGDIARFPNPLFDDVPRRVEHWSIPTDTAKRAAATLVAQLRGEEPADTSFAPIPSFWSDQFDLRLQSYGSPALADEHSVEEGDLSGLPAGALIAYRRDGHLVGNVAVNLPPARQRELREQFSTLVPTA
ncbi:pyridine nucleotide-disulfide oxidoreductase [Aeromicrobium flavum]|uniref:Pyridine nucleotide-disulfide oxidoreductase n=1 Tax=Aeromicrobium flavum TaxID=416568 RepID=A0A512HRA7_9ACTN|nr:FAD-dependent oxidoreductase [Aeromicrobium flavum]GEO87900.1 pyridine nucleotide-disulfide oxidoreductase [Aeromicrobium flavum]